MIFVTVGSQLPFDRLVTAVDQWVAERPAVEIFGQVGDTTNPPKNFAYVSTMSPEQYSLQFSRAELIIGHAGMGTIISAIEHQRPLLMLPRLARLRESRNDNQVGTVRYFRAFAQFEVVDSEIELPARLDHMIANLECYRNTPPQSGSADGLLGTIRAFVNT